MSALKVIPSKDIPPPGEALGDTRKAAEADIVIVIRGDSPGVVKSRLGRLIVTTHERDRHGDLVVAFKYA